MDEVKTSLSKKQGKKPILVQSSSKTKNDSIVSNDDSVKRKKSVSFNEKKNYETKKFSIDAEIERRSINAQLKNNPTKGAKKVPQPSSGLNLDDKNRKDGSGNISKQASKEINKAVPKVQKNPIPSVKSSEKPVSSKIKKRRTSEDLKKKISLESGKKESPLEVNDIESNKNGSPESDADSKKGKKRNDVSPKKSLNSKDGKGAKKLSPKAQVGENEEAPSEATTKGKTRRKSLTGAVGGAKEKLKRKKSSEEKGGHKSSGHIAKNAKEHITDIDHEENEEQIDDEEQHHHHHHHHHPHHPGHPDHHSDEEAHDSEEEHSSTHHHHHRRHKRDKYKNIHLHAHRTREQRTWVAEMRGYTSEPVLPLPFEKKFTKKANIQLKPYMKKLHKKYLSMDDVFLSRDGYPNLIIESAVDSTIKSYAVRGEMLKSWDELFEMERRRYSFFDELFAQGYVLDSLEIPSGGTRRHLIAAEEKDLRSNLEFGRAVFKTKNIYTGEFKDKHFDGVGRYQWIDGTVYQGNFNKGVMDGHGKIEWKDGSLYEGDFVQGTRSGWGIYSTILGYTYLGSWQDGLPCGPGKMWYDIRTDNSDYYDGHWANGIQDGNGTRQYANGDRYIGQFSTGVRNGKGTMIWLKERQVYKGSWSNGVPHGFGTHIWYLTRTNTSSFPTRHIYRGQWVEGKRDGIGKMIYPCGSVYEGRWKDGQRFAKGLFVNPAGELLVGLFRAGSVCGGTEIPLHAPPYECDYTALVEWINAKFHLDAMDNVDHKLHKIVSKHLELFRKLYKRAGQLGQSWGNNGLFPSWLKKGPVDNHYSNDPLIAEDAPHMRGKQRKPHSPDNVYPVFRFGLWLLMKDISGLMDTVTMAHYDSFWSDCPSLSFQTLHNPFEPVYLWQFLQCLIIIAVSYYIDAPNRKYKLRLVVDERKDREIRRISLEKKPHSIQISEPEVLAILDPCAQWMLDHKVQEEEEEFEDEEEEEEKPLEVVIDDIKSNGSDGDGESDNETDDEDAEKRRMSLTQKFAKYYKTELGGEGYVEFGKELDSQLGFVEKKKVVDDDAYSTISYSTEGMESPLNSVESDDEVVEQHPLTILNAFELLIEEKLLKVVKRPPGKHLPRVPDPLPSISDLYYAFKSVNNSDIITGNEFLLTTVPHGVFPSPDDAIYWHRSKELLSSKLDLDSLFENFQTTIVNPPVAEEEPNTLGDEFLGSTINTAENFTNKLKNEAEPEFERSHRTAVEILQTDRRNFVFNMPSPTDDDNEAPWTSSSADTVDTTSSVNVGPRRERFSVVRDPDEMFAESNPFDEADLAKEPFLYTQTRTCDRVARKPFNKKWLNAHDVTRVFRRVYPKLSDSHHKSNIPKKMVFCDWLWCISLCSRISADREFLTVINDRTTLRPRQFRTAPRIGIHSPTEFVDKWKHPSSRLGNSLYYLGEKKELLHVK